MYVPFSALRSIASETLVQNEFLDEFRVISLDEYGTVRLVNSESDVSGIRDIQEVLAQLGAQGKYVSFDPSQGGYSSGNEYQITMKVGYKTVSLRMIEVHDGHGYFDGCFLADFVFF